LFAAHPKYAHKKIIKIRRNKYVNYLNKVRAQIHELTLGFAYLNAGLLTRNQFASERPCDRPNRSRFSVVFLDPKANAELVPKFHVALHATYAALALVTSKFHPNMALPLLAKISPYCSPSSVIQKQFRLYAVSSPERLADTAWEPSKQEI
jgi:hypothetical protein